MQESFVDLGGSRVVTFLQVAVAQFPEVVNIVRQLLHRFLQVVAFRGFRAILGDGGQLSYQPAHFEVGLGSVGVQAERLFHQVVGSIGMAGFFLADGFQEKLVEASLYAVGQDGAGAPCRVGLPLGGAAEQARQKNQDKACEEDCPLCVRMCVEGLVE